MEYRLRNSADTLESVLVTQGAVTVKEVRVF